MKNTGLSIMASLLFFAAGCDKPKIVSVGISASRTTIAAGESVSLEATGSFDHVKWSLPDGQTKIAKSTSFTSSTPGDHVIRVVAYSKKEGKSEEASLKIKVTEAAPPPPPAPAANGQLMLWTPSANLYGLQIKIDGVYAGTISGYYPGGIGNNPCGSAYCVTAELTPGSHVVTATMGTYSENTSISVVSNQCTKFSFY